MANVSSTGNDEFSRRKPLDLRLWLTPREFMMVNDDDDDGGDDDSQ